MGYKSTYNSIRGPSLHVVVAKHRFLPATYLRTVCRKPVLARHQLRRDFPEPGDCTLAWFQERECKEGPLDTSKVGVALVE